MNTKLMSDADSLSLFLRNRADATGELNDYDKELLLASSRVIDELSFIAKKISKEYLKIGCDLDCAGDSSVGIPPCPFYRLPDDADDQPCLGGCELKGKEK